MVCRSHQSKKPNFDSTHELEELLLEDNPLKARKRKVIQDMSNLSAEMWQMEEQCVFFRLLAPLLALFTLHLTTTLYRFTTYDFKKMHRRSYYPHNQQIISQMTATSSTGVHSSRPQTPDVAAVDSAGIVGAGVSGVREVSMDSVNARSVRRIHADEHGAISPADAVQMNSFVNEKESPR